MGIGLVRMRLQDIHIQGYNRLVLERLQDSSIRADIGLGLIQDYNKSRNCNWIWNLSHQ